MKTIKAKATEVVEVVQEATINVTSEKDELLALYAKLKELGITRISDLENKISLCK